MSNTLAIATVMGALNMRVQTLLNDAGLTGFEVTNGHPRSTTGNGVYLSLYQLVPNPGLRNMDLPTRGAGGDLPICFEPYTSHSTGISDSILTVDAESVRNDMQYFPVKRNGYRLGCNHMDQRSTLDTGKYIRI